MISPLMCNLAPCMHCLGRYSRLLLFSYPSDIISSPNGAGKTTLFNVIRGNQPPDSGEVFIKDISILKQPSRARTALGVCPQFTAIDSQLTVREHLRIYGLLRGVAKGSSVETDVINLMAVTLLTAYADRLASTLSGGNQRKLALAM